MKRVWIDGHCHLADPRFSEREGRLDQVIEESRRAGVGGWVLGGVDPEDWKRQRSLQARLGKAIIPCFGLHPWWVARQSRDELQAGLSELELRLPEAAGLGELGLDQGPRVAPKSYDLQREAFRAQLKLARRFNKPLVLHIVRAHAESLEVLKEQGLPEAGGLVHSFSGSSGIARQYLDLGLLISIGTGITRRGFESLKKTVSTLPIEKIVLETDAPDQPPGNLPENRAEHTPASLIRVAQAAAALRRGKSPGDSAEELLDASTRNLIRLFGSHYEPEGN